MSTGLWPPSQAHGLFIPAQPEAGLMAEIDIPQREADALIAMEKHRVDDREWLFPIPGDRLAIPLMSSDRREQFMLDVTRGQI